MRLSQVRTTSQHDRSKQLYRERSAACMQVLSAACRLSKASHKVVFVLLG